MDERQFRNERHPRPSHEESVKQHPFIQDSGQTQQRFQPAAYSAQEEYERSTYDSEHSETHRRMSPGHAEEPPSTNKRSKLVKIGAAVLVGLALLYVLPIPLGDMRVTGSDKVTLEDVKVAGNIDEPVNLLKVRTEKLKDRLSKDLRVEEAQISYEFPLTMVVNIVERRAIAVIPSQFGYLTLDKTGQVVASEPAITATNVPIISGVKTGNILLGDTITNPDILAALTYLNALSRDGFKNIAEVNIGDPDNLLAYTVNGLQLRLGNSQDLAKKAELSESMIKDIETRKVNAQYIDVNLTSPYIKAQ